jgi:transglutaminase-like putative cysteine protease
VWARVQAICDFVDRHLAFGYEHARPTMTSWEAFNEGKGVCRDYAHLAITFCRCMNIPAPATLGTSDRACGSKRAQRALRKSQATTLGFAPLCDQL